MSSITRTKVVSTTKIRCHPQASFIFKKFKYQVNFVSILKIFHNIVNTYRPSLFRNRLFYRYFTIDQLNAFINWWICDTKSRRRQKTKWIRNNYLFQWTIRVYKAKCLKNALSVMVVNQSSQSNATIYNRWKKIPVFSLIC